MKSLKASPSKKMDLKAPPPIGYYDPGIFAEDAKAVLQDWLFVGPITLIPNEGDYHAFQIFGQAFFAIRQKDQSIKVFRNVCAHRFSALVKGSGSGRQIVCPYHHWTYKIDGRLSAAPEAKDFPGLCVEETKLSEVHCEIWQGLIYISLKRPQTRLASRLRGLEPYFAAWGLNGFTPQKIEKRPALKANWKLVMENLTESYHLSSVHRQSIGIESTSDKVRRGDGNALYYSLHYNFSRHAQISEELNPTLEDVLQNHCLVVGLFPNGVLGLSEVCMLWMFLNPEAPEATEITWGMNFNPELQKSVEGRKVIREMVKNMELAMDEDGGLLEDHQKVVPSAEGMRGYLHPRSEFHIATFWRYVATMVLKR